MPLNTANFNKKTKDAAIPTTQKKRHRTNARIPQKKIMISFLGVGIQVLHVNSLRRNNDRRAENIFGKRASRNFRKGLYKPRHNLPVSSASDNAQKF